MVSGVLSVFAFLFCLVAILACIVVVTKGTFLDLEPIDTDC
jgi:Na+-transporting methylmalonyl-CoA/oxaloacetate decarboxylase gamma subunit